MSGTLHAGTFPAALLGRRGLLRLVLTVALPMLLGGLIYLLWRTPDGWLLRGVARLGLAGKIAGLQRVAGGIDPGWPCWFRYSLPDGLWVFAGTSWMGLIWSGSRHRAAAVCWILACPALALVSELAQLHPGFPGDFSWLDVGFYAAFTLFALALLPGGQQSRS